MIDITDLYPPSLNDRKSLAELKAANLPHATCETIGLTLSADPEFQADADAARVAADNYLKAFADTDGKCPMCGANLGGLLGNFEWAITHGEGHCRRCHYPARAIHHIADVCDISRFVLPYHPDSCSDSPSPEAPND